MKASRTQMTHVFKSLKPQNWGSKYPKMEGGWVQISIDNDWVFAIPITYHLWPSKGSFPCSLDFIRPSPAKIWCLPIGRCHFAIHLWWFHKPLQPSEAYLFLQWKGNTGYSDVHGALRGVKVFTPPVIVLPATMGIDIVIPYQWGVAVADGTCSYLRSQPGMTFTGWSILGIFLVICRDWGLADQSMSYLLI